MSVQLNKPSLKPRLASARSNVLLIPRIPCRIHTVWYKKNIYIIIYLYTYYPISIFTLVIWVFSKIQVLQLSNYQNKKTTSASHFMSGMAKKKPHLQHLLHDRAWANEPPVWAVLHGEQACVESAYRLPTINGFRCELFVSGRVNIYICIYSIHIYTWICMYRTQRPPAVLNQPKSSLTDRVDPAPHSMGHALFGWPELVEPLKNHTAAKRISPPGRAHGHLRQF